MVYDIDSNTSDSPVWTNRLRITSAGNVGIGTSSPTQKLDVNGQFRAGQSVASSYQSVIVENTASNGYARALFNVGAGGANGQADISYAPGIFFAMGPSGNDTTTPIVFRNNNATERMRLDSSGNLGIGTSSPAARLSVDSGATALVANFNSTNASGNYVRFQNSGTSIGDLGSGGNLFSGGTAGDFGLTSRAGNLVFGTSSTERMRITSAGSVIVSSNATYNTTPGLSTLFQVMSETAGDTINHVNYSGSSTVGSGYGMRTARGTAASPAAVQVGDRIGAIFMGGFTGSAFVNTGVIQANIDSGTVSASSLPTYMSFLTTPNNSIGRLERMRIDSEGNMGIGTTTTSGYKLTVNGSLGATSITETSALALKENLRDIEDPLDKILQLVGKIYDRKDGSAKNEVGLVADDVIKVIPELVKSDSEGNPEGVNYTRLTVYLLESIKALKQEINDLRAGK